MHLPRIIYPARNSRVEVEEFLGLFDAKGVLKWHTIYTGGFPFEPGYTGTKWIPAKEAEEMYFIEEVDYGFCPQTWLEVEMGDF